MSKVPCTKFDLCCVCLVMEDDQPSTGGPRNRRVLAIRRLKRIRAARTAPRRAHLRRILFPHYSLLRDL